MAKQVDCRKRILTYWAEWQKDPKLNAYQNASMFFLHLEQEHSDMLDFRVRAGVDRWQVVNAWLNGIK